MRPMRYLLGSVLSLAFAPMLMHSASAADPNIVIFLMDDWGANDVGWSTGLTNPANKLPGETLTANTPLPDMVDATPNITALRNMGVYCSSGYTTYNVCSPSRLALMTGRYQNRFGLVNSNPVSVVSMSTVAQNKTLARYLKDDGYSTYMVGKWHLGESDFAANDGPTQTTMGFDKAFYFRSGGGTDYYFLKDRPLDGKGRSILSDIYEGLGNTVTDINPTATKTQYVKEQHNLTYLWTNKAIEYIGAADDAKPIFLYAAYTAVHTELHDPDVVDNVLPLRQYVTKMTKEADICIKRVMDKMAAEGRTNTLYFFLGDNGGVFKDVRGDADYTGDNGILAEGKHHHEEGGIRTPLVVKWTGQIPAGATYAKSAVSSLDIAATALTAAGISLAGKNLDGVDIIQQLKNDQPITTRAYNGTLFWNGGSDQVDEIPNSITGGGEGASAVRDASGNKVLFYCDIPMLYNLVTDKSETTNLLGNNAATAPVQHRETFVNLFTKYIEWQNGNARPVNEENDIMYSGKKCRTKHFWQLAMPFMSDATAAPIATNDPRVIDGLVAVNPGANYTCRIRTRKPDEGNNTMIEQAFAVTYDLIEGNSDVGSITAGGVFTASATNAGYAVVRAKSAANIPASGGIPARIYTSYLLIKVGTPDVTNTAPVVNVGSDQTITLPSTASLSGSVTDATPTGTLTSAWTMVSNSTGGTVSFAPANAASSIATFSKAGVYILRLTGSDGSLSSTDDVQITVNAAAANIPTVVTPASPTGTVPVTGTTLAVSAIYTDNSGGASNLVYSWNGLATVGTGMVTIPNGSSSTATFTQAGTYTITVTVTDPDVPGSSVTSSFSVVVNQTYTGVIITATPATVAPGGTQTFTASANDQFGTPMTARVNIVWSETGDGTIDTATGVYTAGTTGGSVSVTATSGGTTHTSSTTVTPSSGGSTPTSSDGGGSSGKCGIGSGIASVLLFLSAFFMVARLRNPGATNTKE